MTKLYEDIARSIADDIATGKLNRGDRLPTQRALADELNVSLGTVTRAYALAEQRGLIHGRGRRGTVVGPGANAQSSIAALAGPAPRMIDFGGNYPIYAHDPPLGPALHALAATPDVDQLLRYPPPQGLFRHREIGSAWLDAQGVSVRADEVIVTAGAQHGIMIVLSSLLSSGDVLLAEELTYPGVLAAASTLGITVKPVPIDEHGIDPAALARLCRRHRPRALYCIPTLQNPTGSVLSTERKEAIVPTARKHDILIIEDEIHRLLLQRPPPSFHELCPERSYFITSPSKVVAGGLRLGFLVGPDTSRLLSGVHATMFAGSPITAEVFATWWQDGTAMRTIAAKRKESRARQRIAARHLAQLGDRVSFASAPCHHLWVEIRPPWSASLLIARAARLGVSLLPPETFAVDATRAPNALRLSLGAPEDRAALERGLGVIVSILSDEPGAIAL